MEMYLQKQEWLLQGVWISGGFCYTFLYFPPFLH